MCGGSHCQVLTLEHCNGIQWMQYAGQRQLWFWVVFFSFFPQLSSLHTVTWDYHWLDPSRMNANVKKKKPCKRKHEWVAWNTSSKGIHSQNANISYIILHCHFIARPQVIYSLRLTHKNQKAQVLQELTEEKESVLFSASKTNQAVWTGMFFIVHQQSLA